MKIQSTTIEDVKIICPKKFGDHRGFFSETYSSETFAAKGLHLTFCQDNHSMSQQAGTIRGLHFQINPFAQSKLLRVVRGSIYDVAIDIRQGSPTYGEWVGYTISADLWNQILIPAGFAHGFCTLESQTEVQYKVTAPYSPDHERGIAWDDQDLAIDWPLNGKTETLSEKDTKYPSFSELPKYFEYSP